MGLEIVHASNVKSRSVTNSRGVLSACKLELRGIGSIEKAKDKFKDKHFMQFFFGLTSIGIACGECYLRMNRSSDAVVRAAPQVAGIEVTRIVNGVDQEVPMTWEQLRSEVVQSDGVRSIEMGTLREIAGYGRLGTNVLQVLSAKLAGIGLCHLPLELPSNQHAHVLLLQYGTPAADVVTALSGGAGEQAQQALTELNASRDVARVREAALKASELLAVLSDRCGKCLGPVSASSA